MVARNRNKNKRKITSVASATLGTAVGGSGAAALATGYFPRQNQYDNHQYSKNLYTHMMEKNNGNYTGAGDAVYTKDEYLNRMKDYYYKTENGEKVFNKTTGVTEEYANSMINQAENNPNLFISKTETLKMYITQKNNQF